jgi:hypothetical protein
LILSQALTLFTTPVVYLYLDRFNERIGRRRKTKAADDGADPAPSEPATVS